MTHDDVGGLTIGQLLDRAAQQHPHREAYVHGDQRVTWTELVELVDRRARALMAWGVEPGDRVALWMTNSLDWVVTYLSVIRIGGVLVSVNTAFTVAETAYVVGQSDSVLLVAGARVRDRSLGEEALHVLEEDGVSARQVLCLGEDVPGTLTATDLDGLADRISIDELARRVASTSAEDIAITLYTSGTTGFPKGVMHSHRVIGNMSDAADRMRLTAVDTAVMYLPLFHIFALAATLSFMCAGARMVLLETYEAGGSLELMERESATIAYGVPAHYLDQIRHPTFEQRDVSSLRLCLSPGTADHVRMVSERMGPAVNVYGMTETTSMTSVGSLEDSLEDRAETVGRTLPRSSVKIVDEHGVEVSPGVVGELLVRGAPVMQGYYRMPEATAAVLKPDGWFHTGDAGSVDDRGFVRFVGRITEMYKVGGENVDPIEVEAVLMRHPAIAMAAVQGVEDDRLGEVGLAHVTLIDGAELDVQELRAYARERLASFKVPRHVVAVDTLPMTASGKVQKFRLREAFDAAADA